MVASLVGIDSFSFQAAPPPHPSEPAWEQDTLGRLVGLGLLSPEQRTIVLKEHEKSPMPLDELLLSMNFVSEQTLATVRAEMRGVETICLRHMVLDAHLIHQIPKSICQCYTMIPVSQCGTEIKVAMADADDIKACDHMRMHMASRCGADVQVAPVVASRADILEAIQGYYGLEMSLEGILREVEKDQEGGVAPEKADLESPTVRLVNAIIGDAVKKGASDIHFEPEGFFVRVRYRIDGVLQVAFSFHKNYWPTLCVRLKVMAQVDIAESRRPQGGRFSLGVMGREVDFRVSCHPTFYGENLVLRILDKTRSLMSLEELGYSPSIQNALKECLQNPEGMVIVTGPTGCGKTTALYSMLSFVSNDKVNVMTLEEPLEYRLPLVRQTDIHEKSGMTFAEGVRSILRQDPDIILIGEIRDPETATMALRATMTGHQVFTTLHTTDALGAIGRLTDLGLTVSALAGNISCILAQRLVRRLCSQCKTQEIADLREQRFLHVPAETLLWKPIGCSACQETGYRGRVAIAEFVAFDDELNALMIQGASRPQMKGYLRQKGFRSLMDDSIDRVLGGDTTVQEVCRVIGLRAEAPDKDLPSAETATL